MFVPYYFKVLLPRLEHEFSTKIPIPLTTFYVITHSGPLNLNFDFTSPIWLFPDDEYRLYFVLR